ncbi:hypothetical protein P5673_024545 [Acropora cervicornis]|uniref:Uncharacterized protein n=1 Tax=Acropora cervicornis TaxID=6130 RepID=A0AAD9Q3W4_ACRCE|nr:hypothetical protein P5673_024545 [Acropora cervicornis]
MVHAPGVQHRAADAVSCHPTGPANPDMMLLSDDIAASGALAIPSLFNPSGHSFLSGIRCREPAAPYTTIDDELASLMSSSLNTLGITWDFIKVAAASDTNMVQLTSIIESGFPEFRHELPPALCEYHQFRDHLYTVDGVILYKFRSVIPPSLRQHDLSVLHSAHQGVTSMTAGAETTVFWPGITSAMTATWPPCTYSKPDRPTSQQVDKTGIIIEVRQFDQYVVRLDGSGRITFCNRKFLRRYIPVQAPQPQCTIYDDFRHTTLLLAKPAASPTLQPPTNQIRNPPLAKAHKAQFALPLPQHTSALVTLNQQSTLHLDPSQNTHHHQRPLWSPNSLPPPHHPLLRAHWPRQLPCPNSYPPRQHWCWRDSWTTTSKALRNHEHCTAALAHLPLHFRPHTHKTTKDLRGAGFKNKIRNEINRLGGRKRFYIVILGMKLEG